MIGKTLAHYKITEKIGAGGMGEVYLAEDTKLGRNVALKILPAEMAKSADRRMRFEREARAIAALNHANIVTIHAVEEVDGVPFLVMELVEGTGLGDQIPREGMNLSQLFDVAAPLADALAAAHKQGITHRDLKPANVMITADGAVKVLDFGLAKLFTEAEAGDATIATHESGTEDGRILGTVAYMSPEQAEGKPVDARSDIFSLGVLLYEMSTGRRPFAGETSISTITAILRDDPPSVTELNAGLPHHLGRIIRHCLAKDPDERYQSAIDVRNELRALKQEVTSGELTEEVPAAPRPRRRQSPVRIAVVAAAGIAAVAIVGLLMRGNGELGSGPPVPPDVPVGEATVGVIGFENLTDPADAEQIGRMLQGLVTTDLAESGGMNVVSSPKVLAALYEVHGEKPFQSAVASRVARKAGAEVMLVGQVMDAGDGVLLTAELIDVATGNAVGSIRQQTQSRSELFELAEALADEVRSALGVATAQAETPAVDLARSLTESPAAYRAYVAGEAALHERQWKDAIGHLQNAVKLDSTFALAHHYLAVAAGWDELPDLSRSAANAAVRWSDRLPERWRVIVRAKRDFEHGEYDAAYDALQDLAAANVDIAEAYYLLGEIAEHVPKYVDGDLAKRSFERALEIDPSYTIVLFHLITHYLTGEEIGKAWALIDRLMEQSPTDRGVLESRLRLLEFEDRLGEAYQLAAELEVTAPVGSWMAIAPLYARIDSVDALERVIQRVLQDDDTEPFATGFMGRVRILQGRFHEGFDLIEEGIGLLEVMGGVEAQVGWIALRHALIRSFVGDYAEAMAAVRKSREQNPHSLVACYMEGLVRGLSGEDPDGLQAFAALDAIAADNDPEDVERLGTLLAAELHQLRGETDEAWRILEPMNMDQLGPVLEVPLAWWLRARVLEDRGDDEAALEAYRTLDSGPGRAGTTLRVYCLPAVGRLQEKTGDVAGARRTYRRYLARWGDADVEIPDVAVVRERLAALGG